MCNLKKPAVRFISALLVVLMLGATAFGCFTALAADGDHYDPYSFTANDLKDAGGSLVNNIDATFAYALSNASAYANYMAGNLQEMSVSGLPPALQGTEGDANAIKYVGEFFGAIPITGGYETNTFTYTENDSSSSFAQTKDIGLLAKFSESAPHYVAYGNALRRLGLDETGIPADNGFRNILGTVAQLVFILTLSVSKMFQLLFALVKAFNPFQFFETVGQYGALGLADVSNEADAAMGSIGAGGMSVGMQSVRNFFGQIFSLFLELGLTVMIPLSILIFILGFFLFKNQRQQAGQNVKKIVTKILFLAVGIPIIGSTYTSLLNGVETISIINDDFITYAVATSFVDFEGWAKVGSMAPILYADGTPFDVVYTDTAARTDTVPSSNAWKNLRQMAVSINLNYGQLTDVAGENEAHYTVSPVFNAGSNGGMNPATTKLASENGGKVKLTEGMTFARELIDRYQRGDVLTAADYAGYVRGRLPETVDHSLEFRDMLMLASSRNSFSTGSIEKITGVSGKLVVTGVGEVTAGKTEWKEVAAKRFFASYEIGNAGYNFWNDGGITSTSDESGITFEAGTGARKATGWSWSNFYTKGDPYVWQGMNPGFTTMSTFGYLTSEFSPTGMTVQYEAGAPSAESIAHHYSVNLIGGSALAQMVVFFNFIALLGGYVILAFTYIFMAGVDTILRGFDAMAAAIMAALGSYKSVAKFIAIVVSLFLQLFVSIIFYAMLVDIMFVVIGLIDAITDSLITELQKVAVEAGIGNDSIYGEMFFIMSVGLSAIVTFMFVKGAVTWRKAVLGTLNETIDQIVGAAMGEQIRAAQSGMGGVGGQQNTAVKAGIMGAAPLVGAAAGLGALGAGDAAFLQGDGGSGGSGDGTSGNGISEEGDDQAEGESALDSGVGGPGGGTDINGGGTDIDGESTNIDGGTDIDGEGAGGGDTGIGGEGTGGDTNAQIAVGGDSVIDNGESNNGGGGSGSGLKPRIDEDGNKITTGVGTDGSTTTTATDENGNIVRQQVDDGKGNSFGVDNAPKLGENDNPNIASVETMKSADGTVTKTALDKDGNVLSSETTDAKGNSEKLTNNEDGTSTVSSKSADGTTQEATYSGANGDGEAVSSKSTDANGVTTEFTASDPDHGGKASTVVTDLSTGVKSTTVKTNNDTNDQSAVTTMEIPAEASSTGFAVTETVTTGSNGNKTQSVVQTTGDVTLPNGSTASVPITTTTNYAGDGSSTAISSYAAPDGSKGVVTTHMDSNGTVGDYTEAITKSNGSMVITSGSGFGDDGDAKITTTKMNANGNIESRSTVEIDRDSGGVKGNTQTTITTEVANGGGGFSRHQAVTVQDVSGGLVSATETGDKSLASVDISTNAMGGAQINATTATGATIQTNPAHPGQVYVESPSGTSYNSGSQTAALTSGAINASSANFTYGGGAGAGVTGGYTPPGGVYQDLKPTYAKPGYNPDRYKSKAAGLAQRLDVPTSITKGDPKYLN
jgi:hypothetical protein